MMVILKSDRKIVPAPLTNQFVGCSIKTLFEVCYPLRGDGAQATDIEPGAAVAFGMENGLPKQVRVGLHLAALVIRRADQVGGCITVTCTHQKSYRLIIN